jgi:hypothetical protein
MKMPIYNIEFVLNGQTKPCILEFKAPSAGQAQAKFYRQFPDGKILKQQRIARIQGKRYGQITYEIVSSVSVERSPAPEEEELTFAFHDQTFSTRPLETAQEAARRFSNGCSTNKAA